MLDTIQPSSKKSLENSTKPLEQLSPEELMFCSVIEDLVEQWGFKRLLGRVWSLLYLRKKPLKQSQIEQALGISKGNISGLLQELAQWGVAQKVRISGDRNYYYEVDKQIWKSVAHVIQSRELRILEDAISKITSIQETLKQDQKSERIAHQLERTKHVYDALSTAQTLTKMLVAASPDKLARISKIVSRLRNL